MQRRAWALLLFLGLLQTTLAYRVDASRYSPRSNSPIFRRDGDCRSKCSPANHCCTTRKVRRDLIPRTLTTPSSINQYVVQVTEADSTVKVVDSSNDDRNTAVYRVLDGTNAVNVGLSGLCGCTALVVINDRAIYFAHFFENLSFEDDDDQPIDFSVISNFLDNGGPGGPSLATYANVFSTGKTMPFIVSPQKGRDFMYLDHVTRLTRKLATMLPGSQAATEYMYKPLDCKKQKKLLEESSAGRVLFQYDPQGSLNYRLYLQSFDAKIQSGVTS
ncbi:hypothetical protein GP486_006369 [Trichoglossum hirsutum]|uniref:Uncharacterized protein n=1 Tax=Trichoglossum hirsutum TaxID=265104 RepID=A0A9P8IK58_9PEZI|nr:hypothetical protein GP486_006369 [Trichoglossum hirsutum]